MMQTMMFWWTTLWMALFVLSVILTAHKDKPAMNLTVFVIGTPPFIWFVITFWPQLTGTPL